MAVEVPKDLAAMVKVHLEGMPFAGEDIVPAFVNFIFGMNGTGKSTLGRILAAGGDGISWRDDTKAEDYERCLFNSDFVNQNIRPDQGLPGLFMMGEANIDTTGELAALQKRKEQVQMERKHLQDAWQANQAARENLFSFFAETAWDMTKEERKEFPQCLGKAKGSKRKFGAEVFQMMKDSTTGGASREELRRLYQDVYASDFKRYALLPAIPNPEILDNLPGKDILTTPIVSRQDSPFSAFIHALGAADWVRKGHEAFHGKGEGRCPYCQQPLPDDFEQQLAEAFDAQYEENRQRIVQFGRAYQQAAETLMAPLRRLREDSFQVGSYQDFTTRLMLLESGISQNIQLIRSKWESPSQVVEITPLAVQIGDLSDMLAAWNQKIQAHNEALQNNQSKQDQCTRQVRAYFAQRLAPLVNDYQKRLHAIKEKETELSRLRMENQEEEQSLVRQIGDMEKKYVNTQAACQHMNTLLQHTGFQNFHLQERGNPSVYEIVRDDGTPAKALSEGERQFLGFLYFCHQIGSQSEAGEAKRKIVILDDPSTGLDSRAKAAVASLTRELITACLRNADKETYDKKFKAHLQVPVAQIFLLAHDSQFQRAISSGLEQEWKDVSYFLLSKGNGISHLVPCVTKVKRQPGQNINPIPGSYQQLWETYKQAEDPSVVLQTAREIVNGYMFDILGFTRAQLRERMLRQRSRFAINGREDTKLFRTAFAFFTYLDSTAKELSQGESADRLRQALYILFLCLGAEGHYRWMMNR